MVSRLDPYHRHRAPACYAECSGYAIVRHPETSVVERAIRRLVSLVRVEAG